MNPQIVKRACAMVLADCGNGTYQVAGREDTYRVHFPPPGAFGGGEPSCSCPARAFGNECTHILAVRFYRQRHT